MHKQKIVLIICGFLLVSTVPAAEEVNLYSARKEELIKPLLAKFTAATGIKTNIVSGNADALLARLKSEGANSPADVFLTVDAGRLSRAKEAGVLQVVESKLLNETIPTAYRDPEGYWFGLSIRARVFVYATDRVKPAELSSYASLADPRWRGRVCVRSSDNIYNQSLVAALIAHQGIGATESWARGLVANFARPPSGGDRDQIKAVAAGLCDIALVNSYYLGGMLTSEQTDQRAAAEKVTLFWPAQQGPGTHVNVSGAGVTASAKNRQAAVALLEFLVSHEAQQWYSEGNLEYPVRAQVPIAATLQSWGEFKADELNLTVLGENNPVAVRLMDRAGWK